MTKNEKLILFSGMKPEAAILLTYLMDHNRINREISGAKIQKALKWPEPVFVEAAKVLHYHGVAGFQWRKNLIGPVNQVRLEELFKELENER